MDFKSQLTGLNEFLSRIHNNETRLSTLLAEMSFSKDQIDLLRGSRLAPLVEGFISAIRDTLGAETFDIISRLYGLHGEPRETIEIIAQGTGSSTQHVDQQEREAIERFRYKTALEDLSRCLHDVAIAQLEAAHVRPSTQLIVEKLNRLAAIRAAATKTRAEYQAKCEVILARVQPELDALEAAYAGLLQEPEEIAVLEGEIKNDVLLSRTTVAGSTLKVTYSKGRITWDTKGIESYAIRNPEVLKFRRQGRPVVSIRALRAEAT